MAMARRVPAVVSSYQVPKLGRMSRTPQHPFYLHSRPFVLTPFFMAPVLPGETLKSLRLQSRAVTDPVANGLIGWWKEYYFFYVKHRDLVAVADTLESMMLDPAADMSAVTSTNSLNPRHYFHGNGINWSALMMTRLLDGVGGVNWFRTSTETASDGAVAGVGNLMEIKGQSVFDSMIAEGNLDDVLDVDVDTNADDTITVGEIDRARLIYEYLRENGMEEMSYEDYLATYGTRPRKEDSHVPELVSRVSEWVYPSNTIDPETGAPVGAASWTISTSRGKPKFFKEPGFLWGLTVSRPKVYFGNQKGNMSSYLNDAFSWLPALIDDPRASYKLVPDGAFASAAWPGALGNVTDAAGTYVDMKDLFLHGEQWVNLLAAETTPTGINAVSLPSAGLNKRYVSETDMDAMFKNAAGGGKYIREDGLVSLVIAGRQSDTSATT